MNVRRWVFGVAFCAASALLVSSAYSQAKDEKKPADKPAAQPAPATKPADKPAPLPAAKPADKPADKPGAPAAGADMASMMKMMSDMSAPAKEHEALKPLIGTFTCANKFNMAGAPPMESTGEVTRKWIIGNRYIEEEVKGTMMGTAFEGFGISGYDKLQKLYHGYWIDNMGTGWWFQTGTMDAAGKVLTMSGENFDPMANMKKKGRSTLDMTDPNKHVMKMYDTGPDGKEYVAFEMTCTRK